MRDAARGAHRVRLTAAARLIASLAACGCAIVGQARSALARAYAALARVPSVRARSRARAISAHVRAASAVVRAHALACVRATRMRMRVLSARARGCAASSRPASGIVAPLRESTRLALVRLPQTWLASIAPRLHGPGYRPGSGRLCSLTTEYRLPAPRGSPVARMRSVERPAERSRLGCALPAHCG